MTSETAREQFRQYCEGQIEPGSDEERIAWKAWRAALSTQPQPQSKLTDYSCECGYVYLVEGRVIGRKVQGALPAPPAKPEGK